MNLFFDKVEEFNYKRRLAKAINKQKKKEKKEHRTLKSETKEWINALIFGVIFVFFLNQWFFQLYVVPSPSMENTLKTGDRVYVSKTVYGTEIFPDAPKIFDSRAKVQRDDIITFYNPEYEHRGIFFNVLNQLLYRITFTLVNIDRDENGKEKEQLYVKRCCGLAGDKIKFIDGNAYLNLGTSNNFTNEREFREKNNFNLENRRTFDDKYYKGLKSFAYLSYLKENNMEPSLYFYNIYQDSDISNLKSNVDYFTIKCEKAKIDCLVNPLDLDKRSEYEKLGTIYVPENHILPLGDNRDNSVDGRFFGPVDEKTVMGKVDAIYWPIKRFRIF